MHGPKKQIVSGVAGTGRQAGVRLVVSSYMQPGSHQAAMLPTVLHMPASKRVLPWEETNA
jgi:hypothetical protein